MEGVNRGEQNRKYSENNVTMYHDFVLLCVKRTALIGHEEQVYTIAQN